MSLTFPISATVLAPGRLVDRRAAPGRVAFPVRYGLLLHPKYGPILVDTGYTRELWAIRGLPAAAYRRLLAPRLRSEGDPDTVLARFGLNPRDVRHVVVTHLHPDHVCALGRFAGARIHASRDTLALWSARPRLIDPLHGLLHGLLPDLGRLHVVAFEAAPRRPLPWGGSGHDLLGDGALVAVPLPGHMLGHAGILFAARDLPLLYAVDAAWTRAGYRRDEPPPIPARLVLADAALACASAAVVRRAEEAGVAVALCHDPAPLPEDA